MTPASVGYVPSLDEVHKALGLAPQSIQDPNAVVNLPVQQTLPLEMIDTDPHPDNHQHDGELPDHEAPHNLFEDPIQDELTDHLHNDRLVHGVMFGIMPEWRFAKELGFSLPTIASWRKSGKGPRYTMIGKQIFYQEKEIAVWLDLHTRESGT